jgi:Uma2 family endonuclease
MSNPTQDQSQASQSQVPESHQKNLPTMYDLPSEFPEEPGLADEFHDFQPQLLRETFASPVYSSQEVFFGTDLNIYYDLNHPLWHKRPDWFLVLGVSPSSEQNELRLSYVIWQERVSPFLVVELLSPGTEAEDLGQTERQASQPPSKWQVYEQILQVPYYVIYDRYENQLRIFQLVGTQYQELSLSEERFWWEEIQLGLGVWSGWYQEVYGKWLRWFDDQNHWILTPAERAEQAETQAQQAQAKAEALEAQLQRYREQFGELD